MFRCNKYHLFVSLFILFCDLNYTLCDTSRKLSHFFNPDCNSTCGNLIVIKAEGPADILYYVWDFDSKPILTMFEVPKNTNMTVNWDNYEKTQQKSISFSAWPSYIFGVMIHNIYEFNDKDDSGILHKDDPETIKMPTQYFNWSVQGFLDDLPSNSISYSLTAVGYHHGNISKNGAVNITTYVFGSDGHSVDLPRLLHTENSSQVDLAIDNLTPFYDGSRFAVEFITFGTNEPNTTVRLSAKKTLDDENTPGVFTLDTLRVGNDEDIKRAHSGYLQWRPIVYTSPNKVVSNSTKTFEYDMANATDVQTLDIFNSTLAFDFHGSNLFNFPIKVTAENVSFGWSGDGFYKRTNYTSWSFLVGIGKSPEPAFSMVVFFIIAIGLGLPTLIILGGTGFMIYRKIRTSDH